MLPPRTLFSSFLVLVVPTSLVPELLAFKHKRYVGQDFGELSRAAVLVLGSIS